jgi:hypothetical protein
MNIWKQVDKQKDGLPIGRYSTSAAGVAAEVTVRCGGGIAPVLWADAAAVYADRAFKGEL